MITGRNANENLQSADYIIVGAGSAGCVLANRLTENGKYSVILLEAGGSDWGPFIQMPAALSYPMNMKRYNWGYYSEPEARLNHRRLAAPRGKVLGGSSSINGMIFVRGHASDFDHWAHLGARGWSYEDVLPFFKRMEAFASQTSPWRGNHGPLHIQKAAAKNPLFDTFVQAGIQAGHPKTEDYNGEHQEGMCYFQQTIYKGRRWSTANAYLTPAKSRKNLKIIHGECHKIRFEGKRAIGIQATHGGRLLQYTAHREVLLCASAFNSPAILMRSGIGPVDQLKLAGIMPVAVRSGVGQNLQDHLEVYIQYRCKQPVSLNSRMNLISKGMIGLQWLLNRTGLGASNHFEAGAFLRLPHADYPDVQLHFLPAAVRYDGQKPATGHGFQVHVGPMRSKSRGKIELNPQRVNGPPRIRFNYMSHEDDWHEFRSAITMVREILSQSAMDPFRGEEISPGPGITDDAGIDEFIANHAESAYHPCGTCKIGSPNDANSVVDPECRVIGVSNLRVVDSSVFPQITNGNINAPTIMVAEKISNNILASNL